MTDTNQLLPPTSQPDRSEPPAENPEHNWGMFCHLSALVGFIWFPVSIYFLVPFGHILAPLTIWLLKRKQYPFVDEQGKEALNFQISMTIYALVSTLAAFVFIGFFLLMILAVADVVLVIIAAGKANEGKTYRYPYTIRFLR